VTATAGTGVGLTTEVRRDGTYALYGVVGAVRLVASATGYHEEVRDVVLNEHGTIDFELRRLVPVSGPATAYVFSGPLTYPVSDFTEQSSFVLYDNGAYQLRYHSSNWTITGVFHRENGQIVFDDGWATGTLNGDLLEVRYSASAQQADYENAVYRRE
jgi:hypothetical protein